MKAEDLKPGQPVRVWQTIDRRESDWITPVVGTVQSVYREKTGSWHAHGKDGRLWLLRLRLVKPDGETTTLVVDHLTRIELLDELPVTHDQVSSGR